MRRLPFVVTFVGACVATLVAFALVPASEQGKDSPTVASQTADEAQVAEVPPTDSVATSANKTNAGGGPENPFPNRLPAPGLEGGVDWLNTSGPITLKDLRGKIVLLDFWTYCCINCMHILPDLEYLEKKFDRELVVIGVHSAKFENEKESDAIRQAIMRYEIAHPVINDAEMTVWRKYGARSWPTLVLIDPEGNYCGYVAGEGMRDVLEQGIEKLVAYHAAKGTLDRTPVRFDLERYEQAETPLRYPGKVLADSESGRLFISDSNHNRIVVTTLDGKLLETIGSGRLGRADGSYTEAEFDHPQGMALDGTTLYVADTENHLIRKIDLAGKKVTTLAGTGEQASFRETGGKLSVTALNSPWDLLIHKGFLYVAMAGPHQIWLHRLGSNNINVFAGSGREDIIDGPHAESALAQPSGLASDGQALYVCDSEGSAIRRVPFDKTKPVTTIAGPSNLPGGRSLFEFDDIDGVGGRARLQHPLGITFHDGTFYVADSYNHKLKTIQLNKEKLGTVTTLLGTGQAGDSLDPLQFSEPAGISFAGGNLYVADTNNHRILRVNLSTKQATVLEIAGLGPPVITGDAGTEAELANGDTLKLEPKAVKAQPSVRVAVTLSLPQDYKLNAAFPAAAKVTVEGPQSILPPNAVGKRIKATKAGEQGKETLEFAIPLSGQTGEATLRVALSYGYCREGKGGLCKVKTAHWELPLTVSATGDEVIRLEAPPAETETESRTGG